MKRVHTHRVTKARKPNIKAIFFDLGGVLVWGPRNSVIDTMAALLKMPPEHISPLIDRYKIALLRNAETCISLVRRIAKHFGVSAPENTVVEKFVTAFYAKQKKINVPLLRFTERLSRQCRIGIISDTIPEHVRVNRRRGIFRGFKPLILSCDVGLSKPHRAIFRLAARRAHVKPSEAVFVDDLPENVVGARKVGMHGILYKNTAQLKRDLKKLGVAWK